MIYEMVKGLSKMTTSSQKVLPDIIMLKFTIVNAFMVGSADTGWVLVDTGLENSYDHILKTSEEHFGKNSRPKAVILTHGHFDHVGSVIKLTEYWDVNAIAHELEIPYLTGKKNYPQGDPSVDEGLVAKLSPAFPNECIDLGNRISILPREGMVPGMEGWEWLHTPGHCEGHIALFREKDKILIAGDAFTTTKQESLLSVISQRKDVKGPPAYLTTDWKAAKTSVEKLQGLHPAMVLPSHGTMMKGEELTEHLKLLNNHFEEQTVPDMGRFTKNNR